MIKSKLRLFGWAVGLSLALGAVGAVAAQGAPVETKADTETVNASETASFTTLTGTSVTGGIFEWTFEKNDGKTSPAYNATDSGVRVYPKGSLTFAKAISDDVTYTIKSVTFAWKVNKNSKNVYPTGVTPSSGTGGTYSTSGTSFSVTGINATSFSITVDGSAGNIAFQSVTINYSYEVEVSDTDSLEAKEDSYDLYIGKSLDLSNCVNALGPNNDKLRFAIHSGSSFASLEGSILTGVSAGTANIKADYSSDTVTPVYFDVVVSQKPWAPTWKEVSDSLDDYTGTYLLVNGSSALDGSVELTKNNSDKQFTPAFDDGNIEGDYAAKAFIISKYGSGYSLRSAEGHYYGSGSSGDFVASSNPVEVEFDGSSLICGSQTLRYNASHFRFYSSGTVGAAVVFYRLDCGKYVQDWVDANLHFDTIPDTEENARRNSNDCKGSGGYYLAAKSALKTVEETHVGTIADFVAKGATSFKAAYNRYSAWATLNKDGAPFDGNADIKTVINGANLAVGLGKDTKSTPLLVVAFAGVGALAVGGMVFLRKRKEF